MAKTFLLLLEYLLKSVAYHDRLKLTHSVVQADLELIKVKLNGNRKSREAKTSLNWDHLFDLSLAYWVIA